jgi:hypothetical protein
MNLDIINFVDKNNKIDQKHICLKNNGDNILPNIQWVVKNNKIKSFAIIMEDITVKFVHLFIPYINKDIRKIDEISDFSFQKILKKKRKKKSIKDIYEDIDKLNLFIGKNYLDKNEYYGPCAPPKTDIHTYIFRLYALDSILDFDNIKGFQEFEETLKNKNINIINYSKKKFKYSHSDSFSNLNNSKNM